MNRRKVELTTGGLTPSELKLDVKAAENRSLNPAPPEETRSVLTLEGKAGKHQGVLKHPQEQPG